MNTIPVLARPRMGRLAVVHRDVPAGASLADMAAAVADDMPGEFWRYGLALIDGDDGHPVEPHVWHLVRPKPGHTVQFVIVPQGGKTLRLLATIAIAAAQALAYSIPGVGPYLSAAVGLAGSVVLGLLAPKPKSPAPPKQVGTAGFSGNVLAVYEQIPTVLGRRRVPARYLAPPLVEIDGDNAYGRAIIALAGRHDITDPLIDGTPAQFLEQNIREGHGADTDPSIYTDVWWQEQGREMSRHNMDIEISTDKRWRLAHSADGLAAVTAYDLPQFHYYRMSPIKMPQRIVVDLYFPQGLYLLDSSGKAGIPFRLGFFKTGASTIWLPELHINAKVDTPVRAKLIIEFAADPGGLTAPSTSSMWSDAYAKTNRQVTAGDFAHSYYGTGKIATHVGVTSSNICTVYVDPAQVAVDGSYTFAIQAGAGYIVSLHYKLDNAFNKCNYYTYGSITDVPVDYFSYYLDGSIYTAIEDQSRVMTQCVIEYFTREFNEPATVPDNIATYEIRTKNQRVDQISIMAGRYVAKRWTGVAWVAEPHVSSNPAEIAYDMLTNATPELLSRPLPAALVDDASFGEWAAFCAAEGLECNAYIESGSLEDALQIVFQAGHAYVRRSETWGVYIEKDRSLESPVYVYSPRNSRGFTIERIFDHKPHALRVTFDDADDNFQTRADLVVYADGYSAANATLFESAHYQAITTEWQATRRAKLDLDLIHARDKTYSLETDARYLVTPRGSLVGVNYPVLSDTHGFAAIRSVSRQVIGSETKITGLVLDTMVDMQPTTTGVVISTYDRTTVTAETATQGRAREIIFTAPIADDAAIDEGCTVVFGTVSSEYIRCIVDDIQPGANGTARVILVDEAPSVWRNRAPSLARQLLDRMGGAGMAWSFVDGSLSIVDPAEPKKNYEGMFNDRATVTGTLTPSASGAYFDASNYATLDTVAVPDIMAGATMYVKFNIPALTGVARGLLNINNGTTGNRHYIYINASDKFNCDTRSGGSAQVNLASSASYAAGATSTLAYAMTTDNANAAHDQTLFGAGDSSCALPVTLTTIRFGQLSAAGGPLDGYIIEGCIIPGRSSDAELILIPDP